jgi:hypothetical protein
MFRDVVFLNEDGTVYNVLNVRSLDAINDMPDYKDKVWFDYTDWETKPGPQSTYNNETEEWTHYVPPSAPPVTLEHLVAIDEPVADELAGGAE